MPIDVVLLQAVADRLAGVSTNGFTPAKFAEPLRTLWATLDAQPTVDCVQLFMAWAGTDQARLDIAADVLKLKPGGNPPPDPWVLYTLRDAYKPRPPLLYLVEGLVTVPSVCMTYGAPGSLKSLLIADMMVCVSAGVPWLPELDPRDKTRRQTTQAPVLWCDFDNGKRRTDERFEALGRARNLPDTTPLTYATMPNPWLDASSQQATDDLCNRIARIGARMCVIDNLGTVTGGVEENSSGMIGVMSHLRYISEQTGTALQVLHHQRKSGANLSRAGETIRGHSSIEAALDLALLIEREEHSDDITVRSTKTRDIDVFPFGARLQYQHKPGTKEFATAAFWGLGIDDTSSNRAIDNAILDALTARQGQNQAKLVTAIQGALPDVGINRIRSRIKHLVKLGTVLAKPGPLKSIVYETP